MSQLSLLNPTPLELPSRGAQLIGRRKLKVEDLARPDVQARIESMVPLLQAAQNADDVLRLYRGGSLIFWVAATRLDPARYDWICDVLVMLKGVWVLDVQMS